MVDRSKEPADLFEAALDALSCMPEAAALDAPALMLKLRKLFPSGELEQLKLALETFRARRSAPEKLGSWSRAGFFSTSLLEQASREAIARHRAQYFTGCNHVLEIGTGTGSDTAALARVCTHVTTIDGDSVASDLARRNLDLQRITNVTFLVGDAQSLVPTLSPSFDGLFADPARRSQAGERFKDADDYSPPLSFLLNLAIGRVRAIKVSPGLFFTPPTDAWKRQFVGVHNECLEQTLWYGAPVIDSSVVVADSSATWAPHGGARCGYVTDVAAEASGYMVEAHGTINRSQYLEEFFGELGITMLAPDVAYGVAPHAPPSSPLIKSYRILECMPFNVKRLRAALAERGWSSRTELKKRNFPKELEGLRAELKLPAHSHTAPFGVLFFFKHHDSSWVVLAERCSESDKVNEAQ